jgi:ABC-2 type transport system permease protein
VNDLALLGHQVRYENRSFWRNPPAAFFTIAFPLMFLFIFNGVFGTERMPGPTGREVGGSTLYIPMIATFSLITACFTNLATALPFARDYGTLKRIRGTPLPAWIFMLGRVVHVTLLGLMLVAITVAAGATIFGVEMTARRAPGLVVAVLIGAASFSSLGLAMAVAVPNAQAAPAVVNAVVIPLFFVSGVFIPSGSLPDWLVTVAGIFPVKNLADALGAGFEPFATGSGFELRALAIVAAWGAAGLFVAVRYFSWEPRRR